MDIGMLWLDADPGRDLPAKVSRAADYYRGKYGRAPTLCYVHPSSAGGSVPTRVGDLELRTSRAVLPDHYWLGIAPADGASRAGAARDQPSGAARKLSHD